MLSCNDRACRGEHCSRQLAWQRLAGKVAHAANGLRVLWLTTMVPLYHTIATVEFSYPLTWTLASLLFILYYLRGGWLKRCIAKRDAQT